MEIMKLQPATLREPNMGKCGIHMSYPNQLLAVKFQTRLSFLSSQYKASYVTLSSQMKNNAHDGSHIEIYNHPFCRICQSYSLEKSQSICKRKEKIFVLTKKKNNI